MACEESEKKNQNTEDKLKQCKCVLHNHSLLQKHKSVLLNYFKKVTAHSHNGTIS